MVKINSFKGITYNYDKLNPDMSIFAPPYDVISSQYQDELYKRSKYNIVRLILGKIYESDDQGNNRYTRSAKDYNFWKEQSVLIQSDVPKIYYYVQKYIDPKGVEVNRKGFIARCYLEDFSSGQVLPHEETMGGPKKDRLSLMEATKANFSQIFSIYSDPKKLIDKTLSRSCPPKPLVDVVDDDGVRHIFFEIKDNDTINQVKSLMEKTVVLIADGHHRYETALRYRDDRRAENNNDKSEDVSYNSVMMYFANIDDEGLRVYPTHRVLKRTCDVSINDLIKELKTFFELKELKFLNFKECFSLMEKENKEGLSIGLVSKENPGILYVLKPYTKKVTEKLVLQGVPEVITELDVTILHRLILEQIMGLDTLELKNQNNIEFIRNEDELTEKYTNKEVELIFLLNEPDVAKVREICMSGHRMPQKTTYFYPKLLSGLVINPLD